MSNCQGSKGNEQNDSVAPKKASTQSPLPSLSPLSRSRGIDAVHVNAARQMVQLHTRGRMPLSQQQTTPNTADLTFTSQTTPNTADFTFTSQSEQVVSSRFPKPRISIPNHNGNEECKNPQCSHCGKIINPSPQSFLPIQDKPCLKVNRWEIYTVKKPILSSAELDYLGETEFEFPLPEMIFGNNFVRVKYTAGEEGGGGDSNSGAAKEEKAELWFNAIDALKTLDEDCCLKVSYHQEWLESRRKRSKARKQQAEKRGGGNVVSSHSIEVGTEELISDVVKPYDWTYSTNYKGLSKNLDFINGDDLDEDLEIPISRLTQPDPILFFEEMILFEDELADNGISMLSIKIRVMPTCLLILCRFFLRIDKVIFRIRDCRVFIDLEKDYVIREYKIQECDYNTVLRTSMSGSGMGSGGGADPKRLLRDQNWVSMNIPVVKRTIEKCTL